MAKVENRKKLVGKFYALHQKASKNGISSAVIKDIFLRPLIDESENAEVNQNVVKQSDKKCNSKKGLSAWIRKIKRKYVFTAIFILGVVCSGSFYYYREEVAEYFEIYTSRCFIENNQITMEMGRPLAQCDFCIGLKSVPVEHNISNDDFVKKYAYGSIPVLIKDATSNWTAMSSFSFDFFKDLYVNTDDALSIQDAECQFFPYNTDFIVLGDVFNMTDARANFSEGEKGWYVGWSNCHEGIKNKLRDHYQRPYFLPIDSESSALDWIFMGGSGPGAVIHIDYVQRPSWQAQISGKKTWTLVPPPECEHVCNDLNVTVHKGDIFVVDTNLWYHSTFIHPGEISITIGSEYD
ncbi:hypothetical protein ACF0H5_001000 [Mactra antiquata]